MDKAIVPSTLTAPLDEAEPCSTARMAASGAPSGWDPHEVWRTRILLPRLAEHHRLAYAAVKGAAAIDPRTEHDGSTGRLDANRDASFNNEALTGEIINAISFLFAAGLASTFLLHSNRARAAAIARGAVRSSR